MKNLIPVAVAFVWTLPLFAFAQTATNIFNTAATITQIINGVLVPLVFAVAFLIFIINVVRYFIASPDKKDDAKSLILYSVVGFAVMIGVWGLVNILLGTFNLNQNIPNLPVAPGPR